MRPLVLALALGDQEVDRQFARAPREELAVQSPCHPRLVAGLEFGRYPAAMARVSATILKNILLLKSGLTTVLGTGGPMNLRNLALAAVLAIAGQPTPDDAATAETVYRAAIVKAEKDHAAALATATSDYVRGLKEAVATEMKKGDLDAALAIRDRLKAVESEGGGSPLNKLAGTRWVANKGATFEWRPDGTFLHKGGVRPCVVVDATRVVIFFENKRVDVLEFDKGFTKFDHWVLSSPPPAVESGHREGK